MRAIFKDDDGRWTYVMGETEYDLGPQRPGKYIWAAPIGSNAKAQQVCNGGGFRGNTLSWPHGLAIPGTLRESKDRLGRPMTVCDYEGLPERELRILLADALGATPYESRAKYQQHYHKN